MENKNNGWFPCSKNSPKRIDNYFKILYAKLPNFCSKQMAFKMAPKTFARQISFCVFLKWFKENESLLDQVRSP